MSGSYWILGVGFCGAYRTHFLSPRQRNVVPELNGMLTTSMDCPTPLDSHFKFFRGGGTGYIQPTVDKHPGYMITIPLSRKAGSLATIRLGNHQSATPNDSYCASDASETEGRWMMIRRDSVSG